MPTSTLEKWEQLHATGHRHQLQGEWKEAEYCYRKALGRKPDYAPAKVGLAQLQMLQSDFLEGRDLYEARFDARGNDQGFDWRHLPIARWQGENLKGKRLLLWAEQGFGDVILYAAFLPHLLAQEPAQIILSMFPKMLPLFARSFPAIRVEPLQNIMQSALSSAMAESFSQISAFAQQHNIALDLEPLRNASGHAQSGMDFAAPLGDLLVNCLPGFIPARHQASHLKADPARVKGMQEKLFALGPGRHIGISWHTTNPENGHVRSIALTQWLPILRTEHCHFISLQHHARAAEIEQVRTKSGCTIVDTALDIVNDSEGLAALAACMDEIITIDNSNAHLGGALGVPTTVLLPKGCDFRWLATGKETLWYRSVSLMRQTTGWPSLIASVAQDLKRRTG